MHVIGIGLGIGEIRKDQELPRISVKISKDMADYLEQSSAANKRSNSSQAAIMLESDGAFLGWLTNMRRMKSDAIILAIKKDAGK
jgi:hypothetical protein